MILATRRPKLKPTSPYVAPQGRVEGKYIFFFFSFLFPCHHFTSFSSALSHAKVYYCALVLRSTCHASYMILLFKPMLFPLPGNLFFCRDIWPKESITSCLPSLCLSPCIFCCCYCSETSFWNEIFEDGRNVPLLLHRSC